MIFVVSHVGVDSGIRGEFGVPEVVVAVKVPHHYGVLVWFVSMMEGVCLL